MSAGFFSETKYKSNGGAIWPIRVQPETLALVITGIEGGTNTPPSENFSGDVPSAQIGGSRRSYGVHARGITVGFTADAPDGYYQNGYLFLPILRPEFWNLITRGAAGTYLGKAIKVVGKTPEVIR